MPEETAPPATPTPTPDEAIQQVVTRLRQGEVFRMGGVDYRGSEAVGGEESLRSDGDDFVLHEEEFYGSSGEMRTVRSADRRMTEAELRAALVDDYRLRALCRLT